jgi:hypothetical protein
MFSGERTVSIFRAEETESKLKWSDYSKAYGSVVLQVARNVAIQNMVKENRDAWCHNLEGFNLCFENLKT